MFKLSLLSLAFSLPLIAYAHQAFNEWASNPKDFYQSQPHHIGLERNSERATPSQKQLWRTSRFLPYSMEKAEVSSREDAAYLLELNQLVSSPLEMEKMNLLTGSAAEQPWSDDYWPIYSGILGKRYADPMFAYKDNWQENYRYILEVSALKIVQEGDPEKIKFLSPSEKYDLLVGDKGLGLTHQSW